MKNSQRTFTRQSTLCSSETTYSAASLIGAIIFRECYVFILFLFHTSWSDLMWSDDSFGGILPHSHVENVNWWSLLNCMSRSWNFMDGLVMNLKLCKNVSYLLFQLIFLNPDCMYAMYVTKSKSTFDRNHVCMLC